MSLPFPRRSCTLNHRWNLMCLSEGLANTPHRCSNTLAEFRIAAGDCISSTVGRLRRGRRFSYLLCAPFRLDRYQFRVVPGIGIWKSIFWIPVVSCIYTYGGKYGKEAMQSNCPTQPSCTSQRQTKRRETENIGSLVKWNEKEIIRGALSRIE